MKNQKKTKIFIGLLSVVSVGLVCTTLTSCSNVSSSITNNMVNKGDGHNMANGISLKDEVQQALMDKDSSSAFKKTIANKVLYQWYYDLKNNNEFRDQTTFKDNWTQWTKDSKTSYDDKVKSYKSDHGANWPYYFQNEVLDPIGANGQLINPTTGAKESAKDTYVRFQMYDKIRSDFENRVFANDYLSAPIDSSVSPDSPLDTRVQRVTGDTKGQKVDELLLSHPEKWQNIDFYPSARDGYDKNSDIDWEYAYIQHIAFLEYTMSVKPVSTSMVLWKGLSGDDQANKFKEMYNVYDATNNPSGVVPADAKVGYNFPLFDNEKFQNTVTDGFTDKDSTHRATFFFDKNDYGSSTEKTKMINIPVHNDSSGTHDYTDDSSNLIKVNLGTDAFTSLDVTFSATASALWTAMKDGTAIDPNGNNLPMFQTPNLSSGVTTYLPNSDEILKNFLFPDNGLPTGFASAAQTLGKLGSSVTVAQGGQLDQKITYDATTGNHAEIFNHNSDWYKNNYTDLISAFQLSTNDGNGVIPLPYVLIRERSGGTEGTGGVHLIGLDGTGYLGATADASHAGAPYSQARENAILKYRALSNIWGDERYATGMNFIDTDVKSYFNTNEDSIILQLANKMKGVIYNDGTSSVDLGADFNAWIPPYLGTGENAAIFNFPEKQYNTSLWQSLVRISTSLDALNIYQSVITNYSSSFDKLKAFNATETTNLKFAGANGPVQDQSKYKTNDVYKNGLASKFPFTASKQTKDIFKGTMFDVEQYLNTPFVAINNAVVTPSDLQSAIFTSNDYTTLMNEIDNDYVAKPKSSMAQYSENVTTKCDEVNALLAKFGSSNNFTNNYILNAYNQYLKQTTDFLGDDGYFNTELTGDINGVALNQALGSNLYVPKVAPAVTDLNKLSNDPADLSSDLTSAAFNYWKSGNENNNAWGFADGANGNLGLGFSNDKLDYYKSLASIKYLLTNKAGSFDPTNFIKYQTQQLKYGTQYDFAWTTIDSIDYQDQTGGNYFGITNANDKAALDLYKFRTNYANAFDGRLSNIGVTGTDSDNFANTSYADNPDYLKYASINDGTQLMGYKGLISSSGSLSAAANNALFNDFVSGNPMKDETTNKYLGALYQYHKLGEFIDVKNNQYLDTSTTPYVLRPIGDKNINDEDFKNSLTGYIYNNRNNINTIQSIASSIQNSIPGFSAGQQAISDASTINPYTNTFYTPSEVPSVVTAQALISLISRANEYKPYDSFYQTIADPEKAEFDSLHFDNGTDKQSDLNNIFFEGINGSIGPKELLNKNHPNDLSAAVFLDKNNNTQCSRVLFEQIRSTDLMPTDANGKITSWSKDTTIYAAQCKAVWDNLLAKFGPGLVYDLVYKASQNSSNTTSANNAVREFFNNLKGEKLAVYDRRFNDQLGYNWVKDYKDKN